MVAVIKAWPKVAAIVFLVAAAVIATWPAEAATQSCGPSLVRAFKPPNKQAVEVHYATSNSSALARIQQWRAACQASARGKFGAATAILLAAVVSLLSIRPFARAADKVSYEDPTVERLRRPALFVAGVITLAMVPVGIWIATREPIRYPCLGGCGIPSPPWVHVVVGAALGACGVFVCPLALWRLVKTFGRKQHVAFG